MNPIESKVEGRPETLICTSWVVCSYPRETSIWLTAAILRNGCDVITVSRMVRFGRNGRQMQNDTPMVTQT